MCRAGSRAAEPRDRRLTTEGLKLRVSASARTYANAANGVGDEEYPGRGVTRRPRRARRASA